MKAEHPTPAVAMSSGNPLAVPTHAATTSVVAASCLERPLRNRTLTRHNGAAGHGTARMAREALD